MIPELDKNRSEEAQELHTGADTGSRGEEDTKTS